VGALEIVVLVAAAFVAGAVNAVAGGGSLLSFPAILAFGIETKAANVTNTVALWPGYASSSWAYRGELDRQRERIAWLLGPSVIGAIVGSIILLTTPSSAFRVIVPFLIIGACILMAFQDRLARFVNRHHLEAEANPRPGIPVLFAIFVLGIYGAYFGAALGIMTLAVLGIFLPDEAQHSNALKTILSWVMNGVAVLWFAVFGPVHWLIAIAMAVGALAGGYLGVGVARRLGKRWLRIFVIGYGLIVATVLLVQQLT
jgi:uncharacterized membrane protein YfcA